MHQKKKRKTKKVQEPMQEKEEQAQETVDLFSLGANDDNKDEGGLILPGLEEDTEETQASTTTNEPVDLFDLGNEENINLDNQVQSSSANEEYSNSQNYEKQYSMGNNANTEQSRDLYNINSATQNNSNLESLLSMSNKLVAFVGTSKNGTSFLVNSMAEILSKKE